MNTKTLYLLLTIVGALFVNGAAGEFSTDLLIGLSCALPMYPYARQSHRTTASA